jgi:hypothetical protein
MKGQSPGKKNARAAPGHYGDKAIKAEAMFHATWLQLLKREYSNQGNHVYSSVASQMAG